MRRSICKLYSVIFLLLFATQSAYSAQCGEASPNIRNGLEARTSIEPDALKVDEKKQVIGLLNAIKGDWKGQAHIMECVARGNNPIEEKNETSSAQLTISMADTDMAEFKLELYSAEKRIHKAITEAIFIEDNFLKYKDGPFNFKASLLYIKDNFITFSKTTRLTGPGKIPIEQVKSIALYSKHSLMIEDIIYVNGMLASTIIYELK